MLVHDFIYEWDGKTRTGEKPVSWWPGSYHVKIIKLATDTKDVKYLVSTAVLMKNTGTGAGMNTSLKNYIDNFAKKISKKYNINIEKTLWIEIDDLIRVAMLTPVRKVVPDILYSTSWRPIRPNELLMIKPYMDDM